jgi:ComF family protein
VKLQELKHGIAHLFYPRLCEGCSKPLMAAEEVLCISCSTQIPVTVYHNIEDNETALRFAGRIPFIKATSLAYFTNDGLLQHLLHGLKYRNRKETGYYLGRLLGQSLQVAGWASSVDVIIPVPLHKAKKADRGYNQSMLIAEGMSEALNIPASDKLLLRVKETESQTHKTRTERVNNMAGAFKVAENAELTGKHILLCDDVLTTGATIEACALALMTVESVKISIATIGIAVS